MDLLELQEELEAAEDEEDKQQQEKAQETKEVTVGERTGGDTLAQPDAPDEGDMPELHGGRTTGSREEKSNETQEEGGERAKDEAKESEESPKERVEWQTNPTPLDVASRARLAERGEQAARAAGKYVASAAAAAAAAEESTNRPAAGEEEEKEAKEGERAASEAKEFQGEGEGGEEERTVSPWPTHSLDVADRVKRAGRGEQAAAARVAGMDMAAVAATAAGDGSRNRAVAGEGVALLHEGVGSTQEPQKREPLMLWELQQQQAQRETQGREEESKQKQRVKDLKVIIRHAMHAIHK